MYSICLRSCNCCLRMVFTCWFGSFDCLSMTCYRWPNCTSLLLASFCIYGSEAFEAQQVSWTVSTWHICLQDSSGNDYISHCSFLWQWQTSCVVNPLHIGWMRRFFLSQMKRPTWPGHWKGVGRSTTDSENLRLRSRTIHVARMDVEEMKLGWHLPFHWTSPLHRRFNLILWRGTRLCALSTLSCIWKFYVGKCLLLMR